MNRTKYFLTEKKFFAKQRKKVDSWIIKWREFSKKHSWIDIFDIFNMFN